MQKKGYIYFMTNKVNKVLYTGVTNSLKRRVREHFEGHGSAFTSKYNCNKLVYFATSLYRTSNRKRKVSIR